MVILWLLLPADACSSSETQCRLLYEFGMTIKMFIVFCMMESIVFEACNQRYRHPNEWQNVWRKHDRNFTLFRSPQNTNGHNSIFFRNLISNDYVRTMYSHFIIYTHLNEIHFVTATRYNQKCSVCVLFRMVLWNLLGWFRMEFKFIPTSFIEFAEMNGEEIKCHRHSCFQTSTAFQYAIYIAHS